MDLSKIEPKYVKENHLVGLGFYGQGYLFFRCAGVEGIRYEYDELFSTTSPGVMTADESKDSARLSSALMGQTIDNVLRISDCDHLYQVFMGWEPGIVRQYLYYPSETPRRNLDVRGIYSKSAFGYIEGRESPYAEPSPETELFIPKGLDVGFAWYNPSGASVTVKLNLIIRRLGVDVVRDPDLIARILSGSQPCRLTTIGGIGGNWSYRARDVFDVDFVPLDATRDQINNAVKKA